MNYIMSLKFLSMTFFCKFGLNIFISEISFLHRKIFTAGKEIHTYNLGEGGEEFNF